MSYCSLVAAVLLTGCAAAAITPAAPVTAELTGRTAGRAQKCVPVESNEALRYGRDRLILYGRGRTVWVNRLDQDCTGIRPTDVLVVQPLGNRYCQGDLLQSRDPVSGTAGPGCRLSAFVPYRR